MNSQQQVYRAHPVLVGLRPHDPPAQGTTASRNRHLGHGHAVHILYSEALYLSGPCRDDPRPGKKYKMLMNVIMTSSMVIEQS